MSYEPKRKFKVAPPSLFHPRRQRPAWRELPEAVRKEVVRHLAAMLGDRVAGQAARGKEGADE